MYDYFDAMLKDVADVFDDYDWDSANIYQLQEEMIDKLMLDDVVTGNGSGAYTSDNELARSWVTDNLDILKDAISEYCVDSDTIVDHFLSDDYIYFDVLIRCYLLPGIVSDYVSTYIKELPND